MVSDYIRKEKDISRNSSVDICRNIFTKRSMQTDKINMDKPVIVNHQIIFGSQKLGKLGGFSSAQNTSRNTNFLPQLKVSQHSNRFEKLNRKS